MPNQNYHREFSMYFMINWCGISFQWDCFDPVRCVMGLYRLAFYWHSVDPRIWWTVYAMDFNTDYQSATIEYSHGRKGKQVSGWKLSGPLVKFVRSQI